MKQTLLFCLFSILSLPLFSQCVPDELYRDSSFGVYPRPLSMDNPDAGIQDSACINGAYEFTLTLKVPGVFMGFALDSIVIAEEGAVQNLPIGMDYSCNPPNCVFTPMDTLGCLLIEGTATDANPLGDYDLKIETTIFSIISQTLLLPDDALPGLGGNYFLTVLEENSPNCFIVGTDDYISKNIRVSNNPNPFSTTTNIEVYSGINEQLQLRVFDMLGNVVHQKQVEVFEGANYFEFDGAHLATGMYTFSLSNKLGAITRKMVISR